MIPEVGIYRHGDESVKSLCVMTTGAGDCPLVRRKYSIIVDIYREDETQTGGVGTDMNHDTEEALQHLEKALRELDEESRTEILNTIRTRLHDRSPFRDEPVDCILWIKATKLRANDYNPNVMAPAEQQLLYVSLLTEGYTQPVVAAKASYGYTVVDGYHRMQQGKHKPALKERLKGYLPVSWCDRKVAGIEKGGRPLSVITGPAGNMPSRLCQILFVTCQGWDGMMCVLQRNWAWMRTKC